MPGLTDEFNDFVQSRLSLALIEDMESQKLLKGIEVDIDTSNAITAYGAALAEIGYKAGFLDGIGLAKSMEVKGNE